MDDGVIISEGGAFPSARWSAQDGQRALAAWRESGLTRVAWCEKTGVATHRLAYWSAKLSSTYRRDIPQGGFIQLACADAGGDLGDDDGHGLMAALPSGVRLHMSSVRDLAVFIRAVRALT
jgi:hypothetical protein